MNIININVKNLIPYENNPRKNDKAVEAVANSIKEFGFKVPIIIDKNNVIVAGHTRLKAALKLGLSEVPCIIADDLTDKQIKAFRIADNSTAQLAEWDIDKLSVELDDLPEIDFKDFGLDDLTDISIDDEVYEDNFDEEPPEEPKTKYGDIYQLGNHRLMCGDSTKSEDVEKLMNGVKANMVFTDPPYGMKKEAEGILNDNLNLNDLLEFNKKWIPLSFNVLKNNGSWYCWGIDEPLMDIYSSILKPLIKLNKITFRNLITWDKSNAQGQNEACQRMYARADEKCLFVMCGVQGFNTNADNYYEAWEPIRLYLVNEWKKVSDKNDWEKALGNQMGKHYFTKSQWALPTEENYKKIADYASALNIDAFKKEYDEIKKEYDEIKKEYDEIKKEYDEIKKEYYKTRAYFDNTHDNFNNVWHFDRVVNNKLELEETGGHASPKPIALCKRGIKTSSRENEIVLDLFGGSGSTLIACEQLNRKCYTMELDEKYCDVIIKRWEDFTNKKAVKVEV